MKPDSINVMGINFKITYCNDTADVVPEKIKDKAYGYSFLENHEIRIYDGASLEFTWQSILHEVFHMIGDMTRLSILNTHYNEQKHNEVDCFANVLTDVLFRNNLIRIDE